MPPAPKHPGARARRNRSSTASVLTQPEQDDVEIPSLPEHPRTADGIDWHANAKAMWRDIWSSPMAPEFDSSDIHQMFILLRLVDRFWSTDSMTGMKDLAAEIRLSGQRFGISPLDRRRLEWQIEQSEDAKDRGRRRRDPEARPAPPKKPVSDPRSVLRAL